MPYFLHDFSFFRVFKYFQIDCVFITIWTSPYSLPLSTTYNFSPSPPDGQLSLHSFFRKKL